MVYRHYYLAVAHVPGRRAVTIAGSGETAAAAIADAAARFPGDKLAIDIAAGDPGTPLVRWLRGRGFDINQANRIAEELGSALGRRW